MLNIFVPHRWNNDDYVEISALFDKTKYKVRDYSVPRTDPFERIDLRYNVDPQIKNQIKYAHVVVCSNRPAIGLGMSIDEIKYALSIGKPVVAIKITESTSREISALEVPVIPKRKDSLESWISKNT